MLPTPKEFAEQYTRTERLVITLRYCEELSFAEIADVLALDVAEVQRIHALVVAEVRRPRAAK